MSSAVVLSLLMLVAHLAPYFCGTQKICGISTLLNMLGQIWETLIFYNLVPHLEVTHSTLLCPGTVVENHYHWSGVRVKGS